jgi:formate dehydrogenase iron-sulfur subunit
MADKAILFDSTRCTACRGCQAACKNWNETDEEIPTVENGVDARNTGSYENPPDLSTSTWLRMRFTEVERQDKLSWFFTRVSCMHCNDAACVTVCPSGALFHDELTGFVTYDKDLCTGCGYCVEFCPFDVPRTDRNVITGLAKMDKCTLCTTPGLNRLEAGENPACVKACPTKALLYDDRDNLVTLGKQRVQTLKAADASNANLFGETELDGLHVLYVLEDSPDTYGLPVNPKVPGVAIAWQNVIQPLGWIVGGVTIVGLGLNYLVARRAKIRKEQTVKKEE